MKIAAMLLALGMTLALSAPAKALVSFASSIDATLSATSLPDGVSLTYDVSNYDGYASGYGAYTADWSDDYLIEGPKLSLAPSVSASTDALAVIEAASLNDAAVTLENLTNAVSTVDFLLSFDLKAEATVDGGPDAVGKAYATLMVETLEARPSVSQSIDVYAGGDYGPSLARETGAWTFSIVLDPGERISLVVYADVMGYLSDAVGRDASPVPLPGALPLAAAGLASLGGVAAVRRRRRNRG